MKQIILFIIFAISIIGIAKAITYTKEAYIYAYGNGEMLTIQTDKGTLTTTDTTPYKINYKTGDIEKRITYDFKTLNEGFGKIRYVEEITLDGTTDEIKEEFSEQPTSCQTYYYGETKKIDLIRMCNYDYECIYTNAQKKYLVCYWERMNIWKDFSTYEINTNQYLNVERTDRGIKRTGLYGLKNAKFNDIIFTQRTLTLNGTINCSEIIDWYLNTNEGINCSNINITKYGGASPYNYTNQTSIISLCSWKLKTGAITNWTTLNCTEKHYSVFYPSGTTPVKVVGMNIVFLNDYVSYPIYIGNNVRINLYDVIIQTESTKELGNTNFINFYETTKENITMFIDKSAFIGRGGDNPDYFYTPASYMYIANATIKDSYFNHIILNPLNEKPLNYFNGTILMVNSQIALPINVSQSNDNYLSIISDRTQADVCFASQMFGKVTTQFKNANLKCYKLSSGLVSSLYLNLTDSNVQLSDYSGGGYGHANDFQLKYTQTYYLNANMTINCSGDRPENKYNYYGNKMDYAFSYLLSKNSVTPLITYFSAPVCNVTDNSSTYIRYGEPNFPLNVSEKHIGQWQAQRIPYTIQLNPNSNYILKNN